MNLPPKIGHRLLFGTLAALVSLAAFDSAQAQYTFSSTTSSDPTVAGNWTGSGQPTFGASNAAAGIWTTGGTTLNYSAAQGATTFTSAGQYNGLSWFAQGGSSTVNVTGGTLNLGGAFPNDGGSETIWIGNGGGAGSVAALAVTGGSVSAANGVLLGRDSATGLLSISNGSFTAGIFSAAVGAYVGAPFSGGAGAGTLTLGNGGQFTMAAAVTDPFSFGGALASTPRTETTEFLNFTTGSTGKITLNVSGATAYGATGTNYLSTLISNGYVEIGGAVDTKVADFAINASNPAAATLSLAVPEPSTWAAASMGALALLMWRFRQRTFRAS